jgi:predicted nucleotidyltransferase
MTDAFVAALTHSYSDVREVWLFGSRANGEANLNSDWDYWVFADTASLETLRADTELRRLSTDANIDLFVIYDGDQFVNPWSHKKKDGSLSDWKWTRQSERQATYRANKWDRGVKSKTCRAQRKWPD